MIVCERVEITNRFSTSTNSTPPGRAQNLDKQYHRLAQLGVSWAGAVALGPRRTGGRLAWYGLSEKQAEYCKSDR